MSISDPRRPPSENEQNTLQIIQENGISHSHSNKYSALYIPQKISKTNAKSKANKFMSVHLKYSKLSISFWFTYFLHRVENMHTNKTMNFKSMVTPKEGKRSRRERMKLKLWLQIFINDEERVRRRERGKW